jgi:PhzF family phenazine biosynthesis protein
MKMKLYQVDAFTDKLFGGNPAAVCPLNVWLPDHLMQQIAQENNLSETAFYVKNGDRYELRWFTPAAEVDLCGHATLASAYVLFFLEGHAGDEIRFHSPRSGSLPVKRNGEWLTLNFPADTLTPILISNTLLDAFDRTPVAAYKGSSDYLIVFEKEEHIAQLVPHMPALERIPARGVIATAPGKDVDFVSRWFGPRVGVPEDPVTGSAHTTLTPYWSKELGKLSLTARQLSRRGGFLQCRQLEGRVEISGQCRLYMRGEIETN